MEQMFWKVNLGHGQEGHFQGPREPGGRGRGKATTPGGQSVGFPSITCGLFPAASGTELGPGPKGGPSPRTCQALCLPALRKGTLEPVLARSGAGSHSLLPAGCVCSGFVHTHSVHTHAPLLPVTHAFPSFAVRSHSTPQFTRTFVVHLLPLQVTRKQAQGREGTCPTDLSPAPKLH